MPGLRFLKLKSLSRKEYLRRVFLSIGHTSKNSTAKEMFREAYSLRDLTADKIDSVMRQLYEEERNGRRAHEPQLVSELYRLKVFDWGGLHRNSLETTIVNNYVKKIREFDTLESKIQDELHNSMRGYVLCSWYNHWTSIIIEDLFRDHSTVLPAVGQVKQIDFFINDVPFDLKVTYLPEGFVKDERRTNGLKPELTLLRKTARQNGILFDSHQPEARLLEDLWMKHRDHPSGSSQHLIEELTKYRVKLIEKLMNNPVSLIKWLYENQGDRRFDASNRLFLVVVDKMNFFESWKLKRAKSLLADRIHKYLDSVKSDAGREVTFYWKDKKYRIRSDAIFVVH